MLAISEACRRLRADTPVSMNDIAQMRGAKSRHSTHFSIAVIPTQADDVFAERLDAFEFLRLLHEQNVSKKNHCVNKIH